MRRNHLEIMKMERISKIDDELNRLTLPLVEDDFDSEYRIQSITLIFDMRGCNLEIMKMERISKIDNELNRLTFPLVEDDIDSRYQIINQSSIKFIRVSNQK